MKRYGRHVSRIRNLKHPLTVYPAMGWPPSCERSDSSTEGLQRRFQKVALSEI